jgi:hypothetical protein
VIIQVYSNLFIALIIALKVNAYFLTLQIIESYFSWDLGDSRCLKRYILNSATPITLTESLFPP